MVELLEAVLFAANIQTFRGDFFPRVFSLEKSFFLEADLFSTSKHKFL